MKKTKGMWLIVVNMMGSRASTPCILFEDNYTHTVHIVGQLGFRWELSRDGKAGCRNVGHQVFFPDIQPLWCELMAV